MNRVAWSRKRYAEKIALYKRLLGGKCVACGAKENLQFDHIDKESKKFCITDSVNRSDSTILLELKKCQLLCRKCHAKKSIAERGHKPRVCGRYTKYAAGCRCAACRAAWCEKAREMRRERIRLGMKPKVHGLSGHRNYNCRCKICRAAAHERYLLQKQKRGA